MATSITFNNVSYSIPGVGDSSWGSSLSAYLIAIASASLQKSGGSFSLTADVDFGSSYGLKATKFSSRSTPSTTGIVRLGNNEAVGWRNAANGADLLLKVNSSNVLEFNGAPLVNLALGTANQVLKMNAGATAYEWGKLTTDNLDAAAGIVDTQLATISTAGKVSNSATTAASANTASAIVARDGSGNFSAGTITASLSGNVTGNLTGNVIGNVSGTAANVTGIVDPANGGTGVANNAAATLTRSGNHALTLTTSNTTNVTLPTTGTLATLAGSETLSSKTLTAPVIDQANFTQAASATTPASGKSAVYVNSGDAKLHVVDSSGNDVAVGSGSSGRNYLGDWFDAAKDIGTVTNSLTNVVDTSDRTANKTTWGSSDTSLLTIARSASSPLRQTYSYLITEAGSSSGAFVESPLFTLDSLDLGKPVTVSFDVSGNSTSDYYQVYIVRYDTNDVLKERIPIAGTASATSPYSARLPVGTTNFQGFFVAGSTSTDQYALRIVSNNNSADSLKIDSLYVGPQSVVQGAAVTDWVTYTPTNSNSTNATSTAQYRQVGDSIEIIGRVSWSAGGSGSSMTITLPTGMTADTTKYATGSSTDVMFGQAQFFDSGVAVTQMSVYPASTTTLGFWFSSANVAFDGSQGGASDVLTFRATVPIVNMTSNVTMANRAVEEYSSNSSVTNADDTTSFAYGAAGSYFPNVSASAKYKRIRFQTPIQKTDSLSIEVYWNGVWQPLANIGWAASSATVGMSISNAIVGSTDVDVYFGASGYPASPATTGNAWSAVDSDANYLWRVRKVSGQGTVGFPINGTNLLEAKTYQIITSTSTISCAPTYVLYVGNGSSITFNLTTAVGINGTLMRFKNIHSTSLTIDANSTETIDGSATKSLAQWATCTLMAYEGNWVTVA